MSSKPAKPLTREQILEADDLGLERVDIPEWGGFVFVRRMNGVERGRWEQRAAKAKREDGEPDYSIMRQILAAETVCDESGSRLFEQADIDSLGRKNGAALTRICDAAMRLNRLADADLKEIQGN